jgi:hypothetical protein
LNSSTAKKKKKPTKKLNIYREGSQEDKQINIPQGQQRRIYTTPRICAQCLFPTSRKIKLIPKRFTVDPLIMVEVTSEIVSS